MMGGGSAVRTAQTFYDDKAALSDDRDYSYKARLLCKPSFLYKARIDIRPPTRHLHRLGAIVVDQTRPCYYGQSHHTNVAFYPPGVMLVAPGRVLHFLPHSPLRITVPPTHRRALTCQLS